MDVSGKSKGPKEGGPHIEHWEAVYARHPVESRSWFQVKPELSLRLIERAAPGKEAALIDVGGGASSLVDHLASAGYRDLTVLDVSASALRTSRQRLEAPRPEVDWIECDILEFVPSRRYDLWHDRALFHFMTSETQRTRYAAVLEQALAPGGQVIIATFAIDGPERCSGLPVRRYDAERLMDVLGEGFTLRAEEREEHLTPGGALQAFTYFLLRRQ
jgi:2-polyprenyl-3-methyl-5-hydroxy-6-metoxy-1,4-benzoquinol methylase